MSEPHRVVIIGGGFGGLYAAKRLRGAPVDVTLVDRRNFHLFQPLLYQVATGALSPGEIASPLRYVLNQGRNIQVLMANVADLDVQERRVILSDGMAGYDTLIVAAGARHHYFGNDHWEDTAPGLKTIEDATEIRRRILLAFEAAEREADPARRRAWLTFVIVGGGPTGVELAGAIGEIANDTLRYDFHSINPAEANILLLESSGRVLGAYTDKLSDAAEKSLIRLGVRVRKALVIHLDDEGVTAKTDSGEIRIAARTVLWAAGVAASPLGAVLRDRARASLDRVGRVVVEPDCTIPGHPEIFVIGDMAHFAHQTGQPLPGVAPVAMQQGRYAADTIVARLKGRTLPAFRYADRGSMATIGRGKAVADVFGLRFDGAPAWLAWLFIHLMYLVEFNNRLVVLFQWAYNYVTRNRGARLITGEARRPEKPGELRLH
ncbi:MAG: NAD(P)/FAD-dependent oxidoreductase [Bryobacterales bacterium]|nr:NAD(P)/FAD-dependent oxidoreductase [Bryobacterales bacterium]